MSDEIRVSYPTGQSLIADVWQSDGSLRESDIALTENAGLGLYLGDCGTIAIGDLIIAYESDTGDYIGGEEYTEQRILSSNISVLMSDLTVLDAVADNTYSDTTIILSDLAVDFTGLTSDLETIQSDVTIAQSDLITAISDIDEVLTHVRTTTHTHDYTDGNSGAGGVTSVQIKDC